MCAVFTGESCSSLSSPYIEMVLNYDVLIAVMSFLRPRDLSSTMRSCRALYIVGVPYLLQGRIRISSRSRFFYFCRFMLRDAPHRFRYLRDLELTFCGQFKTPGVVDLFVAFFTHAKHLESLRLLDCGVLTLDPRIPEMISTLPKLRELTIHSLNDNAHLMLRQMQAPLEHVEVSFFGDDADGPVDPVPLFAARKETLRELNVTFVEFASVAVQYPLVSTLYVDDCQFAEIRYLVQCYPHLRTLALWMGLEDDRLEEHEIEEHRMLNLAAQHQGTWDSLERLSGSILSLYMLAVRTKVACLELHSGLLSNEDRPKLVSVLADTHPASLALRIDEPDFDLSRLGGLLAPVEDSLTHMMVQVAFRGQSYVNPSRTLNRMLASLSQIPLHLLKLSLEYNGNSEHTVYDSSSGEEARESLADLDQEALANEAFRCVPSMRLIALDVNARITVWEVLNEGPQEGEGGSGKKPVKLPEDVAFKTVYKSILYSSYDVWG